MATVRYGIIGSGMMGQEHIRNIQLLDDVVVSAIADPNEDMRSAAHELAGSECHTFEDYQDLLATDLCDVYVVAAPNHDHFKILKDLIPLSQPVLIEKPLCTTVADAQEIVKLAEGRKAPIWVAMEYRYMPSISRLIEEIGKGRVGKSRMISIREHRFPFLPKVNDWNRFSENTGGTMVEKCCHFFDLMQLLSKSRVTRVYASGGMDVNHQDESYGGRRPDIVDNAFVIVDFDNGVRAMLDLCMFAEGSYWQESIAVIGDTAKAEAMVPGPQRFAADGQEKDSQFVFSPRGGGAEMIEPITVDEKILSAGDHHGSTYYQHQKFLRMVRRGGQPEVSLIDGMNAVIIGAAAEESIKSGLPVEL